MTTSHAAVLWSEKRLLVVLVVLSGLLIAGGLATRLGGSQRPAAPLALGDVSEAQIVEIRDGGGDTIVSGEFRSRVDALGNTEKDAALTDHRGQRVVGEVELEIPGPQQTHRRPELEVDIMGLPANQTFAVAIDDRIVATFRTDDRGSFDQEIQEGEAPQ